MTSDSQETLLRRFNSLAKARTQWVHRFPGIAMSGREMAAMASQFRILRGEVVWLLLTKFGQHRTDLCTPLWDKRCSDKVE
jgi:hypothetical protein